MALPQEIQLLLPLPLSEVEDNGMVPTKSYDPESPIAKIMAALDLDDPLPPRQEVGYP